MNKEKELTQLLVYYIELQELLEKDIVDLDAINVKLKQIATIKKDARLTTIISSEDMKEQLNPEQP